MRSVVGSKYKKRIGIYYSAVGIRDGVIYTHGPFSRYLKYISGIFEKIVLIAPILPNGRYDLLNSVECENISVVPVDPFSTTLEALKKRRKIKSTLKEVSDSFDVLWMRYPTQFGEILFDEMRNAGKKIMLQIVGDPVDAVLNTDKYRGLMRCAAIAYAKYKEIKIKKISRYANVYTNGSALYDKFSDGGSRKNVKMVISSALVDEDYHVRNDSCDGERIKLLYVGYLQKRKGVEYLIMAFHELRKKYRNISLNIVGDGEEMCNLKSQVKSLGLEEEVTFKGYIPMGPELRAIYRESDIYIFPTLAGEGTPRTVLEAMANSLPVIATDVCGIPDVLSHEQNGILIRPRDEMDIEDAVSRLIDDGDLRRKIIRKAYKTAMNNSMKRFMHSMIHHAMAE